MSKKGPSGMLLFLAPTYSYLANGIVPFSGVADDSDWKTTAIYVNKLWPTLVGHRTGKGQSDMPHACPLISATRKTKRVF